MGNGRMMIVMESSLTKVIKKVKSRKSLEKKIARNRKEMRRKMMKNDFNNTVSCTCNNKVTLQ